jgi:hypothetical protein
MRHFSIVLLALIALIGCPQQTPNEPLFDCAALACADDDPCTADICEPASGCAHPVSEGALCDDHDLSTAGDLCDSSGGCAGSPIVCPTGVCIASRVPNGVDCEVTYAAVGADCDDDNLETGADACDANHDCLGDPIVCPSGPCVVESSANGTDCDSVFVAAETACDDQDRSTRADRCDGEGLCAGTPGPCTGIGCEACAERVEWPLAWFAEEVDGGFEGRLEFGQTHLIASDETRIAPALTAGREALVLFTPESEAGEGADVRVAVTLGETLLYVLRARPPSEIPGLLEQQLTSVPLEPYSRSAWSFILPYRAVTEGVRLRIGVRDEAGLFVFEHQLTDLAPPHIYTISRTKMVLFGEPGDPTETAEAHKLAHDFFSVSPAASLRFVDALPWRLDEIVVRTADGPRLVHNEAERLAATDGRNRYGLFRHHISFRHNLANTGRGLNFTGESEGNNSPFGFGTSVGMGWLRDQNGNYRDINNGGVAGGWTGWSALWLGECANVFVHEVGHSMTFAHFTDGTANRWGIGDEYPQDGTNVASHPWGYDSGRRLIRTWYRVNRNGPVRNDQGLVGKRDPMNGGEGANAVTCFPQYTAFHARKGQRFMRYRPTLRRVDGVPGAYLWNDETHLYDPYEVPARHQPVVAVEVPVMLVTGTLGNAAEACQTYPPIHAASGNVFALPDPTADDLDESFDGARYFLEVDFDEAPTRRALIAVGEITDTTMYRYSVNLAADDRPTAVRLMLSPTGYPDIDLDGALLQHTRALAAPELEIPAVIVAGDGELRGGGITLGRLCTAEIDCASRSRGASWLAGDRVVHFEAPGVEDPGPPMCSEDGMFTHLSIPVTNDDGDDAQVVVYGQRVIEADGQRIAVPLTDRTPWLRSPTQVQSLKLWLPYEPNSELAEGTWFTPAPFWIDRMIDGVWADRIELNLSVRKLAITEVDIGAGLYATDTVESPRGEAGASSVYYVVADATMGPTGRVWWNGPANPVQLAVPVRDVETLELKTLTLNAWKIACGERWDLNSGQTNWPCENHAELEVAATGNEDLLPGHTYTSPGSSPLRLSARRWHAPGANQVLAEHNLSLRYTVADN